MDYKVRKMTIWQRLYVKDTLLRHRNNTFQMLGIIAEHGIKEIDGEELETREHELPSGHIIQVLTEKALTKLFEKYPPEQHPNLWNEILQKVGEVNKLPFGTSLSTGEQEPNSLQQ